MFPTIPFWIMRDDEWHELAMDEFTRCSQFLSYQHAFFADREDACGTFTFETVHLSRAVYNHLDMHSRDGKVTTRDLDFLQWLRGRDRDCIATTFLPSAWRGIEILILKVIDNGSFEAWCPKCGRSYAPDSVVQIPPKERIGSIFDRRACPAGHLLSQIEVMHAC